ncbi:MULTISPECIES: LysR family transcriptional regulator [Marivita]|uniref:LysR family transcriptional regulator n=1 Tax=Marivita cryptomonadis TaxID=505252 RepID=A0A9Q2NWH8_9RHOB|nr:MULTISPECIES: LysR family transcriptional regulator [Marivita]MCR9170374.1 LysR family transcriptional regulator [Paracoccaceae bacterium]MBM2322328.1 LysR family transcriptional regulator [Marivita cryptomonadis]MBM2331910.1 LysR family transcriptional regulator [Marivita cryptomonadis]MBM2341494.1 LysR family transcriptional regulator [Marivita cryptomonadis]MBM2346158.1 LysR family transcriptional regulator [Marivita cryptomonadis]
MIDRLRQMAIFAKIIDHGSFRGAARELRLSPSVVSHHVSQLEESLGVALIYRSTRKLTLTAEGHRLLAATHKMLEAVEGELVDLSVSASAPSGELRLTVPSVLSQSLFTQQIAAFSQAHPRIKLFLDFSDTRRALIDDGFDIAIRMGPKVKNSATTRKLFSVERKLVASAEYLAERTSPNDPNELVDWDWLALSPAQNVPLVFSKAKGTHTTIRPQARISVSDAQALYQLAKAGAGLAIVPDFLANEDVGSGSMKYVLPNWELHAIDVFAAWPANAPKHGLIHLALDALSHNMS